MLSTHGIEHWAGTKSKIKFFYAAAIQTLICSSAIMMVFRPRRRVLKTSLRAQHLSISISFSSVKLPPTLAASVRQAADETKGRKLEDTKR